MSRWMAPRRAGSCGARATRCSRVAPEAGAPMSQTRHVFERRRHRWRKCESRAGNDGRVWRGGNALDGDGGGDGTGRAAGAGVLGCWGAGVLGCWALGLSGSRALGLSGSRALGSRALGLSALGLSALGLSGSRALGAGHWGLGLGNWRAGERRDAPGAGRRPVRGDRPPLSRSDVTRPDFRG
ncbi:hypothetical protein FPQ37_31765 [Burkholderia contaminans]|nr:hypothetical protein FPQ37_31765 [Burkholderia contaminans]